MEDLQKRNVATWQNKETKELKYGLLGVKTKRGYRLASPAIKPNQVTGKWMFVAN